jgi:hypothetical protein
LYFHPVEDEVSPPPLPHELKITAKNARKLNELIKFFIY